VETSPAELVEGEAFAKKQTHSDHTYSEKYDNILEKIHENIQKKHMLDFLQKPTYTDSYKIKIYEKEFPKPVFSPLNMVAGGLMKDFETPEF
jgi:hypothetical protein